MKHVLIFYSFSYYNARAKCNSNQCNETTPTHGSLQVNQFHNDWVEESKKKIRKFQDSEQQQVQFFSNELGENDNYSYSHIIVFEQRNEFDISIMRTFFCKRSENSTIQLLKCADSTIRVGGTASSDEQSKYFNTHLCQAANLLKDCIGGYIFPYEVLIWLTKRVIDLEFLISFSLN